MPDAPQEAILSPEVQRSLQSCQEADDFHGARSLDRRLLGSMACSVGAAAIEVIFGYTAAHHVTETASKTAGYLVCLLTFLLCVAAVALALPVRSRMKDADDSEPRQGRRLFMANLNLLVAGFVTLLVVAGTCVLIFLRPDA